MEIKTEKTYKLSQENILELVADFLNREHKLNIQPKDLHLDIRDSDTSDWHGPSTPARINSIWVTI